MKLTQSEVKQYLRQAGFQGSGLEVMAAIAQAESGLDTAATLSSDREYSVGIFQINLKAHPGIAEYEARDPQQAAKLAYILSGGGSNFTAWSSYNTGKYQQYLPAYSSVPTLPPLLPLPLPPATFPPARLAPEVKQFLMVFISAVLILIAVSYIK